MEIYQQQLLRKFRETLQNSWEQHKTTYGVTDTPDTFIEYLIDNQLIKEEIIRRYTIGKEFKERISEFKTKSELIALLSKRYNLSTRVIWNYIRQ